MQMWFYLIAAKQATKHGEERGEDKLIIDSWAIFLEAIAIT